MATTPFPYPAFPSATTYPPHPYGCSYPPPIPYPNSIQIHGGYYPPPPYLAGYGSSPPQPSPTHQQTPDPWSPPPIPSSVSFPFGSCPASAYEHSSHPVLPDSSYQELPAVPKPRGTYSTTAPSPCASSPSPGQDSVRVLQPLSVETATPAPAPRLEPFDAFRTSASMRQPDRASTTENSRALYTGEKSAGNSSSVLHPVTPYLTFRSSSDDLSKGTNTRGASIHRPTPSTPARVTSTPVTGGRSRTPSWLLDNVRTPPNQECTPFQSSVNSLHGEISKLSALVSQLAVDMGLQTTTASTASTAAPVPSLFCAAVDSSGNFPSAAPTAAYVAPKVFDEMPSPNSWQETHGTAPDYGSGHQNPIQSSCLSNLSEQNLGGMPQSYGFSNLNRQSIILADGTERSYFTLPADYPLKQATPQMSPSAAANIAVTAQLPVEANEACLTAFCCSKTNSIADSETMLVHDVQPPTAVQDNHKEQNDEKAVGNVQQLRDSHWNVLVIPVRRREWDPGEHTNLSSTLNKDVFGVLIRVLQQSCYYRVPSGQENHSIQFLWDPGILSLMDIMLSQTTVPSLMDLKQLWAQLLLQCHFWYTSLNAFLQVRNSWLPIVLDCLYSESLKKQVHYSIMFSLLAMCMSTATSVRMGLVLWFGKIAQEEKDTAAVYQVLKIQSMRKTSHIWDPVIESIKFFNNGLHVHKIQLVHCFAIHACYLIHAVLPHAQITANSLSNIEAGEVTSRCLGFHLHQINNGTSTTSSAFASFQYAYTIDFVNGQFEFFNQQVAQGNYSAQHLLLFSQQYIKIREIGTFFITFLPP